MPLSICSIYATARVFFFVRTRQLFIFFCCIKVGFSAELLLEAFTARKQQYPRMRHNKIKAAPIKISRKVEFDCSSGEGDTTKASSALPLLACVVALGAIVLILGVAGLVVVEATLVDVNIVGVVVAILVCELRCCSSYARRCCSSYARRCWYHCWGGCSNPRRRGCWCGGSGSFCGRRNTSCITGLHKQCYRTHH